MSVSIDEFESLRRENESLRQEVLRLKGLSNGLEASGTGEAAAAATSSPSLPPSIAWEPGNHTLTSQQIERYGRQMLLPAFGPEAQDRLCRASVLVVGAGGLGSPCILYLAAAGVGRIGVADSDAVSVSNLHRQVIHREATVGRPKVESARETALGLNSSVVIETHREGLTPENAADLVARYDLAVDCSDNAPTRYLLSDSCVATGRPLVSGAAVGTDGQLSVYAAGSGCPCYRCVFPEAPAPQNCQRCDEAGVLGVVPGVIGVLQALEAIKLISGKGDPLKQKLLIFDAMAGRFTTVRLRAANPDCAACGAGATITRDSIKAYDYRGFTGAQGFAEGGSACVRLLKRDERVRSTELQSEAGAATYSKNPILDVRPREQFEMARLAGSVCVPFGPAFDAFVDKAEARPQELDPSAPLLVICRRGNDSQLAVRRLREAGFGAAVDLEGGLEAWREEADPTFPGY